MFVRNLEGGKGFNNFLILSQTIQIVSACVLLVL